MRCNRPGSTGWELVECLDLSAGTFENRGLYLWRFEGKAKNCADYQLPVGTVAQVELQVPEEGKRWQLNFATEDEARREYARQVALLALNEV